MKKLFFWTAFVAVIVIIAVVIWNKWFSPTRIAFVNYQITTLGQIAKSNNNSFIKIKEVGLDDLSSLDNVDMVMVNGMGLRLTQEQRETLLDVAGSVPVLTTAATNPDNYIISIDESMTDTLVRYLNNGGRANYRNMLNYIRLNIDKKTFKTEQPQPVALSQRYTFYHANPSDSDDENLGFNSVLEYDNFLKTNGLYRKDAPRILLTGQMGEPNYIIEALEKAGNMVYPVNSFRNIVKTCLIDSIQPDAVVNLAHGRLGDFAVEYLKRQNIPLFTTVYVPQLTEDWENDKMGMNGGFLSQSVVTPEIDGAIHPYAIFAHRINEEGIQEIYAVQERLDDFVKIVNNYISLKNKPNNEKKIVIYYYKGPGQNTLVASGMQVVPSLFNLLTYLKEQGYNLNGMPESSEELGRLIQQHGSVLGTYAKGAFDEFVKNGNPLIVSRQSFDEWSGDALTQQQRDDMRTLYGDFPGDYMATPDGNLAVARLQFGNVVIMPQPMAGLGDNEFKIVHGTDAAPPYTYVAAYLWAQRGFNADAIIHFGTHGSLEYTPRKQNALCSNDWPDRLVGTTPHLYLYTISNVGEAMLAKRRAYATLQSYLTPSFKESGLRNDYRELAEAIKAYFHIVETGNDATQQSLKVKQLALRLGLHRSLELDSVADKPYTEDEITRIDNFAEELSTEKVMGTPYVLGVPYASSNIDNSVLAMTTDPIAYSLLALDAMRGDDTEDASRNKSHFTAKYLDPAKRLVLDILANPSVSNDATICRVAKITQQELDSARSIHAEQQPVDMLAMMMAMAEEMPGAAAYSDTNMRSQRVEQMSGMKRMMQKMGKGLSPERALKMAKMMGADDEALAKMKAAMAKNEEAAPVQEPVYDPVSDSLDKIRRKEIQYAESIIEIERAINNVNRYKQLLQQSPQLELASVINALNGRFTEPSPGGDPIVNPNTLPTGRNLFGINVEATPSESAWEKGKLLVDNTINMYRQRHNDSLPRKVSYTLWSGEFIETEGATLAQVLYMLGVEPVRDAFGRVTDLQLIPSQRLGRPRIDVVVQTSGQLRDIAASRLFLINRAVTMAADAQNDEFDNFVAQGVHDAESTLVDKGLSPKEARQVSYHRVFGGVNGNYGTGIQSMVQAGDQWDDEKEIADTYLSNMGAFYGDQEQWESVQQYALEAALLNTDAVVQPRQSNTWGALSLDHVYEFMGGMNLAVRNVTGKDPDAYLSDYRNRNNMRMQEVKEAIGVESRATLFNPNYIADQMKGGATAASGLAELVQNTYGWNVMKPKAVDNEMWNEIYDVYVKDKYQLGVQDFFETQNHAALQEITAVMMESARKGMWKASEQQLSDVAKLHTELIEKHKASCLPTVCNNAKLRDFIASKTTPDKASDYNNSISSVRNSANDNKGLVMQRENMNNEQETSTNTINNVIAGVAVVVVLLVIIIVMMKRRKERQR